MTVRPHDDSYWFAWVWISVKRWETNLGLEGPCLEESADAIYEHTYTSDGSSLLVYYESIHHWFFIIQSVLNFEDLLLSYTHEHYLVTLMNHNYSYYIYITTNSCELFFSSFFLDRFCVWLLRVLLSKYLSSSECFMKLGVAHLPTYIFFSWTHLQISSYWLIF
jgi:hypothetical protein